MDCPLPKPSSDDLKKLAKMQEREGLAETFAERNTDPTFERTTRDFWEAALQHHYEKNKHHPENNVDATGQKKPMDDTYLQESVIDVIASILEKQPENSVFEFLQLHESTEPRHFWSKKKDMGPFWGWYKIFLKRYQADPKEVKEEEQKDKYDPINLTGDQKKVHNILQQMIDRKCGQKTFQQYTEEQSSEKA
jgi:hypothetical protein